jgi:micrococcal nuclease
VSLQDHTITTLLVVLLVAAATVPASSTAGGQPAEYSTDSISGTEEATVIDVTDGDTIDIRYDNGTTETVRLLGVDTPEVYAENEPGDFERVPDTDDGRTCLSYEGKVPSAMAENRLLGERFTLKHDSEADRRGYYGRLLAYVYVHGEHFNYQLVENGHARVYDSAFSKSDEFDAAEDDA